MAIVVTDNCQQCRFTECVMVCPVSCFHGSEEMVYIDNGSCIECRACIPACPVHAIFDTIDLPEDKTRWISINAKRAAELPIICEKQPPHPTAESRRIALGF